MAHANTIRRIRFSEIESFVPQKPGIYEIYTDAGLALKVGIGVNIRKRLLQHRASRQDRLKLKIGGHRSNPSDVRSKESILAKHLYYDAAVAPDYDLKSEAGRRAFLEERCHVRFEVCPNKTAARYHEEVRERQGHFRYVRTVLIRRNP